jgi:hypothetical protein
MPNYRVLKHYETSERESLIAQVVSEIVNSILHIRLPGRSFIEEIYNGGAADFTRPEPINGLFYLGRIYILRDLPDDVLVTTVSHEIRHSWQSQTGKFRGLRQREADADLFSREFHVLLGQPSGSKIAARLVTAHGMKCRELSPYIKDIILNKGAWNNGAHKFESGI